MKYSEAKLKANLRFLSYLRAGTIPIPNRYVYSKHRGLFPRENWLRGTVLKSASILCLGAWFVIAKKKKKSKTIILFFPVFITLKEDGAGKKGMQTFGRCLGRAPVPGALSLHLAQRWLLQVLTCSHLFPGRAWFLLASASSLLPISSHDAEAKGVLFKTALWLGFEADELLSCLAESFKVLSFAAWR